MLKGKKDLKKADVIKLIPRKVKAPTIFSVIDDVNNLPKFIGNCKFYEVVGNVFEDTKLLEKLNENHD
jgi:ribosome-associated toxin RatA of RatAB toxin-antitoxin module